MVVSSSKVTEAFSDLALTVTPSKGALVSSKTFPLNVVFSMVEISEVAVGKGTAVGLASVEGLAGDAGLDVPVGVGLATGAVEGLAVGAEGLGAEGLVEVVGLAEAEGLVGEAGVSVAVGVGPQATRAESEAAVILALSVFVYSIV